MLSLKYEGVKCPPILQFSLRSDFESPVLNTSDLIVTAYLKDKQLDDFACIPLEAVKSKRFILGSLSSKRSQGGHLRALVEFNCNDEYQSQILSFSPSKVTIAILRGSSTIHTHGMLLAVAHFDMTISTHPDSEAERFFDVKLFKQVNAPLVHLPAKKATGTRTYYNIVEEEVTEVTPTKVKKARKNSLEVFEDVFDDYQIILPLRK